MFDVITFGSATWDIFIRDEEILSGKNKKFSNGKSISFPLGSKVDIDNLYFSSGGGGTNTAASFASQGLKTAYCGMVGFDPAGEQIIKNLEFFKVATGFVSKTKKGPTNHSIVMSIPGEDRTIFVYKGASGFLGSGNIAWTKIKKTKWFYLAPLSGGLAKMFEEMIDFGKKNNIKIAVNPGNSQLNMPKSRLKKILKKTDILFLNQEESSLLTGLPYRREKEIFAQISSFYPGIFVMTKGTRGATASCGSRVYEIGTPNSKVIDRTGAGDSFGAGFVSGIIAGKNIKESLQLASANATACLRKWGAKNGLLKKNDSYRKIKVTEKEL